MNLSRKLGPRARYLAETRAAEVVESVVEIARSADLDAFERELKSIGGRFHRRPRNAGIIAVDIAADHLDLLARLRGVIYVETGELVLHH